MEEETVDLAVNRVYRAAAGEAFARGFRLHPRDEDSTVRTIVEEDAVRIEGHIQASIAAALGPRLASLRVSLDRQVTCSPGSYPGSQQTHAEVKVSWTPALEQPT